MNFSIECCKNPKSLVISTKLPVPDQNSDEEIEKIDTGMIKNKNINKKNNKNSNDIGGVSPEETEQTLYIILKNITLITNEKININYAPYQKMQLKISDINMIYKSGIIRSDSST